MCEDLCLIFIFLFDFFFSFFFSPNSTNSLALGLRCIFIKHLRELSGNSSGEVSGIKHN